MIENAPAIAKAIAAGGPPSKPAINPLDATLEPATLAALAALVAAPAVVFPSILLSIVTSAAVLPIEDLEPNNPLRRETPSIGVVMAPITPRLSINVVSTSVIEVIDSITVPANPESTTVVISSWNDALRTSILPCKLSMWIACSSNILPSDSSADIYMSSAEEKLSISAETSLARFLPAITSNKSALSVSLKSSHISEMSFMISYVDLKFPASSNIFTLPFVRLRT